MGSALGTHNSLRILFSAQLKQQLRMQSKKQQQTVLGRKQQTASTVNIVKAAASASADVAALGVPLL